MKRNGHIQRIKSIRKLAQRIAEKFDVERIILFGSYAYGKPKRYSDVDLLVVLNEKRRNWKITWNIYRAISPLPFSIDVVVRTKKELQERIPLRDWFLKDVTEQGIAVYESSRS